MSFIRGLFSSEKDNADKESGKETVEINSEKLELSLFSKAKNSVKNWFSSKKEISI